MKIECAHCGRVMSMEAVVCGRTGNILTEPQHEEMLDGHTLDSLAFDAGEFYDLCYACDYVATKLSNTEIWRLRELEGFSEMWCEGW